MNQDIPIKVAASIVLAVVPAFASRGLIHPVRLGYTAVVALVIGCTGERTALPRDSGAMGRWSSVSASSPDSAGTCLLAELWSACLLRKALENAGLAPQELDSVNYPFFRTGGRRWKLGRAELQTFIYPSIEALDADLAGFDSAAGQPRGGSDRVAWASPPIVIRNRNLLAMLIGGSERHDERIRNALEAGVLSTRPR